MAEKENLSQNSNDFIPSSQDSPATTTTQRLHLELDDEESLKLATETQFVENEVQTDEPSRPDKRQISESETEKGPSPRKSMKLDESVMVEGDQSGFSDVEVLNHQERTDESIEVVTIGDSLSESPETFSGENKSVKEEVLSEPSGTHQQIDEVTQKNVSDTQDESNSIENIPVEDKSTNDADSSTNAQPSATIETPNSDDSMPRESLRVRVEEGAKNSSHVDLSNPISTSTPDKPLGMNTNTFSGIANYYLIF